MRTDSLSDRRVSARLACHLQVDYRSGPDWRRATTMDLSRKGCRLRLGESLAHGAPVQVRITRGADGAPAVALDGVVVWTRLEGLSYQAGIHFPVDSADLAELLDDLV